MNDLIVKNVNVLGSGVMAAQDDNGTIWVGVRWLCDAMGMSEGQRKRQITNIQKDIVLKSSGANLILNKGTGEREVFCIKNDYVPMWLAKISITNKIQEENQTLAKKLIAYQLKAKDILAEAFYPKRSNMPMTTDSKIALLAQGHTELKAEVEEIKSDIEELKQELPILPLEADIISKEAKQKGAEVLGGKGSNAYKSKSLRQNVFTSIYGNLKYNFGITGTYKKLKRSQCEKAVEIIRAYQPPLYLKEKIDKENNK